MTTIYRALSILLLLIVILPYAPVSGRHRSQIQAYYTPAISSISQSTNSTQAPVTGFPLPSPPIVGSAPHFAPVSGVLRVAVIAAQFANINATVSTSQIKQEWSVVNQYYQEVSYGTVKLQVDVYGWYSLPYPEAYYGKDCLGIDDADCSGSDGSWHIAQDAITLAQHDLNVNNYDYFSFVHSGNGEESSGVKDDVWSVTYLGGVWLQTGGKSITKFSIIPELEAGGAVPIGVYAHEFGHQLGLPDLYNIQTGRTIMGPWTLMDAGLWNGNPPGSSPAHFDSWCKTQLGFISGTSLAIANSGTVSTYTIDPTELPTTNIHAVEVPVSPTLPPSQYYLVEVREQVGFDQALPSSGVLILYVDETLQVGRIRVMNA
ncbi:MAG TPA: M6 family metalloprotease domain-containing protein, partial [Candidatus Saccharimonadales bacterium]|nr:M6 family metalloprotease domain-containing protein [Candidatus Saccharimonadales bacterium]